MKINSSVDVHAKDPITGKPSNAAPSTKKASPGHEDRTSVAVSSLGGTLSSLQTDLATPSFDAAKVNEIKQAMRDGKFQVNANVVADKLIASVQDMLAGKAST
jgi:negative regulator of flagellin synthesis FlgM